MQALDGNLEVQYNAAWHSDTLNQENAPWVLFESSLWDQMVTELEEAQQPLKADVETYKKPDSEVMDTARSLQLRRRERQLILVVELLEKFKKLNESQKERMENMSKILAHGEKGALRAVLSVLPLDKRRDFLSGKLAIDAVSGLGSALVAGGSALADFIKNNFNP